MLLLDIFHPFCYWKSILLIKHLICRFSKIKFPLLLTHLLQTISGLASPSCSGVQILVKSLWNAVIQAVMLKPPPSENCKASTMNLKVKYLFPSSSSGANFCIYQLPECLGMRKINMAISPLTVKSSIKFQKIFQPPPHLRFYYFDSPNFYGP